MAAALPADAPTHTADTLHPTAGLALRAPAEESAWCEDGDLCVAVIGYPRWSDADLAKLTRGNLLRVFREAEAVAAELRKSRQPSLKTIEEMDGQSVGRGLRSPKPGGASLRPVSM